MDFLNTLPVSIDVLITLGLYVVLGGAYLLVIPLVLTYYLKARWMVMGSLERLGIYGLVFLFFPGFLLLSPLLNFRPPLRSIEP